MSHARPSARDHADTCWAAWWPRLEAVKEAAAKNGKYWTNVLVAVCSGAAVAVQTVLTSDPDRFKAFHENPKYSVEGKASDAGPAMKLTQAQVPEDASGFGACCRLQMVRDLSRIRLETVR